MIILIHSTIANFMYFCHRSLSRNRREDAWMRTVNTALYMKAEQKGSGTPHRAARQAPHTDVYSTLHHRCIMAQGLMITADYMVFLVALDMSLCSKRPTAPVQSCMPTPCRSSRACQSPIAPMIAPIALCFEHRTATIEYCMPTRCRSSMA